MWNPDFGNDPDYTDLAAEAKRRGDVMTIPLHRLRDAMGHQRLRVRVVARMQASLDAAGLEHWPREVPHDQTRVLHVWNTDSLVQELFEAFAALFVNENRTLRHWRKMMNKLVAERAKVAAADAFLREWDG